MLIVEHVLREQALCATGLRYNDVMADVGAVKGEMSYRFRAL